MITTYSTYTSFTDRKTKNANTSGIHVARNITNAVICAPLNLNYHCMTTYFDGSPLSHISWTCDNDWFSLLAVVSVTKWPSQHSCSYTEVKSYNNTAANYLKICIKTVQKHNHWVWARSPNLSQVFEVVPTSSKLILEDKLNSHAVYLTLGQHSVLHKIRQHLHHSLLNGFYNQMHPVDRNETPGPSPPCATSSSSASRNSEGAKCRRRMTVSSLGPQLLSDRLTDRLRSSALLGEEVPSVQMPLPLVSSSSSLIWASPCVSASQTPAWRDILQSPPAASGTHNCARLLRPSVCFVCVTLFYSIL